MIRSNRSANDFNSVDDLKNALQLTSSAAPAGANISNATWGNGTDGNNTANKYDQRFVDPMLEAKHLGQVAQTLSSLEKTDDDRTLNERSDWVLENFDTNITEPQSLDDELRRLLVLKSYLILDSEKEEIFEKITGLAGRIMNCPIALVSLVDMGRQWFMSNRGLTARETSRKTAFCAHTIQSNEDFLIVKDATKDFRFKDNPLVTGPPDIRFYAGAPLRSPEGFKLGTLCVIDSKPRPQGLDLEEKQNLRELADMTVEAMTRRRKSLQADANSPSNMIAQMAHDLLTPLTGVQLSLATLVEDEELFSKLTVQERKMLSNASSCSDVMEQICGTAIYALRKHQEKSEPKRKRLSFNSKNDDDISIQSIKTDDLVNSLYVVLESFPKNVPVIISVDASVPEDLHIDELKVFRSALNYLSNACSKTESGSIQLIIKKITDVDGFHYLLFECIDTAPNLPVEQYPHLFRPNEYEAETSPTSCIRFKADGRCEPVCVVQTQGLGLYSVAVHIGSLGGEYGFRPRESASNGETNQHHAPKSGNIFWFKVPVFKNKRESDS